MRLAFVALSILATTAGAYSCPAYTPSSSSADSVMRVTSKYHTNVTPKGGEHENLFCVESRAVKNDEFSRDCGEPTDCWTTTNNDTFNAPCAETWLHKYNSLSIGDQF